MAKRKSKVETAAAAAAVAAVKAANGTSDVALSWGGDGEDLDDELRDEVLAGLQRVSEEAPGEISWELYCETPIDRKGQIRKLGTAELPGLRDECLGYGPGQYYVIARHAEGELRGTFVKDSRKTIRISGFARTTAALPTAAPAGDPLALMQQFELRLERQRAQQKAERDATLKFWAPLLAPIGVELAKGLMGRGGGESIKDLVAALVGMKSLMGGDPKESQVDILLRGIELAKDLTPGSNTGSTWPDVIASGIRDLRPLAEGLVNRRAVTPAPAGTPQLQFAPSQPVVGAPATTVVAAPGAAGATPTAAAAEDPMLAMFEPLLRRLASELEEFAVNGADPGLAAEALLAKVPRMIKSQVKPDQVKGWLTQPDWWVLLTKFQPSLQPYQGFCDDVRLSILELLEGQVNPPADEEESAG